ncbi:MAG TPA: CBS domain-containing protein, partial [bacterium]|nr:CBS domain-containing protein [bacterium]
VEKALKTLRENNIHHLPIIKDDELVGIVTERDLLQVVGYWVGTEEESERDRDALEMKVKKIMKKDVITCSPEFSIKDAAELMLKHKIGSLVVLDDNKKVIGIITVTDMLKAITKLVN